MDEGKGIGVYICRGCDIGKSLDIEALSKVADEAGARSCKVHDCLCAPEGVETIREDLKDGVGSVVLGACSPRAMTSVFRFEGTFVDRVSLREHVVWTHEPNNEDTQMLAEDYLRMGVVKATKASLPVPVREEVSKDILVVGGGATGMKAALEAATAGYAVRLLEKEDHLGGWVNKSVKTFPKKPPYDDLQATGIEDLIQAVRDHEKITVHTSASIDKIHGQPGQFDVTAKAGGKEESFRVGAIVQATGWKPYDPAKLEKWGYGKSPNVVTNVQMEEMANEGTFLRPSDGQAAKSVAFLQCAGSRDPDHLPYCSAVCCRVSLKQAMYVRERNPDADVYILYRDIRAPGQYEDFYRKVQDDPGVFLTKGDLVGVEAIEGDRLRIELETTLIEPKMQVEADLVVLATGMVPNAADGEGLRVLAESQAIVASGENGAKLENAKKSLEKYKHLEGTNILNLNYRQGPDLPVLRHDFPDSHFICFPYETRRTGIYAAGCVRAPNDSEMCMHDGMGAATKAIQCVELTSQGQTVHPRWEDMSYPDFFLQRCTQCKRCTEECPFGTLNEDEKGTPKPNSLRCRRCGICLGACPERIISFKDYSPDIIGSMIKSVEVPDEEEEKPRFLVLLCENDAYPALDTAAFKRMRFSPHVRIIPVRCLGSVNVVWVNDALAKGYDGVLMVGCKSGDDYQCHFIRGSELMGTRGKNIKEKLQQLVLEEERVRLEELSIADYDKLPEIIDEFATEVEELGPNPFKGF